MNRRIIQLRSAIGLLLRLLRLAVVILVVLVTTVIAVGAVLWRYQSDFLARYVSSTVTRQALASGYRLDIGDITGSPFESVILHDISLRSPAGDSLLSIEEIRFRYPPVWGLRRELSLEALTVSNAHVLLEEAEGGGLRLPWRPAPRRATPLEARPANRVEELNLADVAVDIVTAAGDTVGIVDDYYLDGGLLVDGDRAELTVTGSAGVVPVARLDVDWLTFEASLADGRIDFQRIVADVGTSHAEGTGTLTVEGPLYYLFETDTAHVETEDAWEAIDLADVLGHGNVEGDFRIEKAPLGVYLSWRVAGVLNDDPISSLEGRVQITDEEIDIEGLRLASGPTRVSGDVWLEARAPRRYRADLVAREVDLADLPIHDELVPLHHHRLNGRVSLTGRDYERPFPEMSVRAEAGPSTYLGVPIDSLALSIELVPGDTVRVTDAWARLGPGVARAHGYIAPEATCEVDVYAVGVPVERLVSLHHVGDLTGAAAFAGRVSGDVEHPAFTGTGSLAGVATQDVAIGHADLSFPAGVIDPFRAEVSARAEDVRIAGFRADSLTLVATLGDTIVVHALHAEAPDSALTASGVVVRETDGTIRARVDRLVVDVPPGEARLSAATSVRRAPDGRLDAGPASFAFAGGELRLAIETDAGGARPHTTLALRDVPLLDLLDPYVARVPLAGGVASVDLEYLADASRPELRGTARLDTLRVGEIVVDDAAFAFDGRGDALALSGVEVDLGGALIRGGLTLAGAGSVVRDLAAPDPVAALARPDRDVALDASVEGIDVSIASRIADIVSPAPADTTGLIRLLYTRDQEAVQDLWHALEGRADVHLSVDGRLAEPSVRLDAASDSLVIRGQGIDGLRLAAVYRDSLLTISQGEVTAGGQTTQITGFVPVDLDLARGVAALGDREMLVALDMPRTPLSLVGVIFPDLVVIQGYVTGAGTLQGTPREPNLDGTFRVEDGELRLAGRTEWVWDAKGRITLTNDAVIVNDFVAREGSKGHIRATGNWSRMDDYRFQIELEDFTVTEQGMIGLVSGTINMSPDTATAGRLLPRFDGVVRVTNGEIFQWPEDGPEQTSGAIDAIYDLTVEIGRVNVNTNELQTTTNAVIGDGELTVRNYPETLRLGGELTVLEGGGTVYGNQFRVRSGTLTFLEVDGVNPELDIVAETRIGTGYAEQRGLAGTDPKIIATVTGTLKEPVIQLTTEPEDLGLSQTEIFEYLTIGRFATASDVSTGLEPTAEILLGLIAQDIARALPYVDHVEVTTSEETPSISFVKSLSDEFTIGYTTGVSSSPDQEISVEARLSRILVLKGGVIREELGTSGDPGGRYNLDLRLNFEY